MRQNPARRTALLDGAIDVLAREGARGLTLRAVDKAAAVPVGTASNYFANRGEMLAQVMQRVLERLAPDPEEVTATLASGTPREVTAALLRQLLERTRRERRCHLALLEMRLESTRRPELNAELTGFFEAQLKGNLEFHLGSGLPGDRDGVVVLYLAMLGLIVDDLTVPGLLAPYGPERLVDVIVGRALP
ncbi:TetR family transcriptional regulator [Streptomyces sp. NPDC051940]|uniref:TetR/AcrR family transcriptional regulator n=1 Tax=Streptomyces sp. NPDC051940 TaxID=3155675 RepID=UPI003438ABEB